MGIRRTHRNQERVGFWADKAVMWSRKAPYGLITPRQPHGPSADRKKRRKHIYSSFALPLLFLVRFRFVFTVIASRFLSFWSFSCITVGCHSIFFITYRFASLCLLLCCIGCSPDPQVWIVSVFFLDLGAGRLCGDSARFKLNPDRLWKIRRTFRFSKFFPFFQALMLRKYPRQPCGSFS